jgi:hypothetical protein
MHASRMAVDRGRTCGRHREYKPKCDERQDAEQEPLARRVHVTYGLRLAQAWIPPVCTGALELHLQRSWFMRTCNRSLTYDVPAGDPASVVSRSTTPSILSLRRVPVPFNAVARIQHCGAAAIRCSSRCCDGTLTPNPLTCLLTCLLAYLLTCLLVRFLACFTGVRRLLATIG